VRIPSEGAPANGGPTLLDFDGNARNGEARALSTLQRRRFPLLRLWPSERAHFSDSLLIFEPLERRSVGGPNLPVGFSLVGAVAAYLTKHPASIRLDTGHAFRLARGRGPRSLLVGPCRLAPPQSHAHHRGCPRPVPTAVITARRDTIVPNRCSAPSSGVQEIGILLHIRGAYRSL
jgi:hypothetical protein